MPIFTANVPGVLKVGDRIEIGGKIKQNARKMSVNLCAQEGEEPKDVVLHFDVRFHRDNIISLSRKNGVWIGSGNYDTNYNMFVPGTIFRIIFEIKDTDVITIYCQGKFHSNFLPKIPLSMARYVVAWADIDRITHCYFHTASAKIIGKIDNQPAEPPVFAPNSPRQAVTATLEMKRNLARTRKTHMQSSNDSSADDMVKSNPKHDKFFHDAIMCQSSPESLKYRKNINKYISKMNHSDSDSESDTEGNGGKNETSTADSDVLPDLKKRGRRGKFGSLANVVNFIGKGARR